MMLGRFGDNHPLQVMIVVVVVVVVVAYSTAHDGEVGHVNGHRVTSERIEITYQIHAHVQLPPTFFFLIHEIGHSRQKKKITNFFYFEFFSV
jgi:hypothetical protein